MVSGTILSSKTPGLDFKDTVILDEFFKSEVDETYSIGSEYIFKHIWYQFQWYQEPSCPPRLQDETWRTGWVLMDSIMSEVNETLSLSL